jgi:aryl-alcohol dehydrogenase-like predicted oxidoreductase
MDHLTSNPKLYNVPFKATEFNGMPYRYLGRSGLQVSNIGLGTWKFGFPETGDGSRVNERQAFDIFDRAIQLGVTFWDTANRYNAGSGNSERVIGRWLKSNSCQRRNVTIATKVFGGMDGYTPNHSGLSRGNIVDSVYACLQRMQTDYIDLLYFHGFDPNVPIEESLAAVEDLIRQDMVRYFAVSNFSVDQLAAYQKVQTDLSIRCKPIAVQNGFDLLQGEAEQHQGVLDYCGQSGISFIAWSPLARGLLTGRYSEATKLGPGDRLYDEQGGNPTIQREIWEKVSKLAALASEWQMELGQLVMAYMLRMKGMGPIIPASSTVSQLESNASAAKIVLSEDQLMRIQNEISGNVF